MKLFEMPEIEIDEFVIMDVITTSTLDEGDLGGWT